MMRFHAIDWTSTPLLATGSYLPAGGPIPHLHSSRQVRVIGVAYPVRVPARSVVVLRIGWLIRVHAGHADLAGVGAA